MLLSETVPKFWAKGFIVPLSKRGNKEDPPNYRGISICSCLGIIRKAIEFQIS